MEMSRRSVSGLCGCPKDTVHIVWFPPEAQFLLIWFTGGGKTGPASSRVATGEAPLAVVLILFLQSCLLLCAYPWGTCPGNSWLVSGGNSTPGLQSLLWWWFQLWQHIIILGRFQNRPMPEPTQDQNGSNLYGRSLHSSMFRSSLSNSNQTGLRTDC